MAKILVFPTNIYTLVDRYSCLVKDHDVHAARFFSLLIDVARPDHATRLKRSGFNLEYIHDSAPLRDDQLASLNADIYFFEELKISDKHFITIINRPDRTFVYPKNAHIREVAEDAGILTVNTDIESLVERVLREHPSQIR